MKNGIPTSRADCEALDTDDPLQEARKAFALPDGVIYLDGHSLGPATHAALKRVSEAAGKEWKDGLIGSWNSAGWFDLPHRVGARLAGLIGAEADEVVVCDSVSVNLFKLAAVALEIAKAKVLIVEESEFPTDQYVLEGLAKITGAELRRVPAEGGAKALAEVGGVLVKSVVNYRTARVVDMAALEKAAEKSGGVIVWDLCHAAGVVDLGLREAGARFAAGCTYKFLNGGPGAPAFIYVRRDLAVKLESPISGWFGHARPFEFSHDYKARLGTARFAAGTPGILSMVALDGALDAFNGVGWRMPAIKARALGDIVVARAKALKLEVISPTKSEERGGHVSVRHEEGYAVVQALIACGVVADFRAPDAMRFGMSPLYLRYVDVWDAMDQLADVLATSAWDRPEFKTRAAVT